MKKARPTQEGSGPPPAPVSTATTTTVLRPGPRTTFRVNLRRWRSALIVSTVLLAVTLVGVGVGRVSSTLLSSARGRIATAAAVVVVVDERHAAATSPGKKWMPRLLERHQVDNNPIADATQDQRRDDDGVMRRQQLLDADAQLLSGDMPELEEVDGNNGSSKSVGGGRVDSLVASSPRSQHLISPQDLAMEDVGALLDTEATAAPGEDAAGKQRVPDAHKEGYVASSAIGGESSSSSSSGADDEYLPAELPDALPTTQRAYSSTGPAVGPGANCNRSICRLCDALQLDNSLERTATPTWLREYLQTHVLLSVITGSFENYFRIDVALCTWLRHMPLSSVHIFTDRAADRAESGPSGVSWHEAELPRHLQFTKKQLKAKGYTIAWIRAQYRFMQAFQFMGGANGSSGPLTEDREQRHTGDPKSSNHSRTAGQAQEDDAHTRAHTTSDSVGSHAVLRFDTPPVKQRQPRQPLHWAVVADDDTFVNVEAMAVVLTSYDVRELARLGVVAPGTQFNASTAPLLSRLISQHRSRFQPLYIGDRGWGGGGHVMNFAALQRFAEKGESLCVERYMIARGFASDVTLTKCLPLIGVRMVNDRSLSHCQATFLRSRLTSHRHMTAHMKRDLVKPPFLALWRARLYYQVVYHRNHTDAFQLLMKVGSCAYGYSCKLRSCTPMHDKSAVELFMETSGNASFVPTL